MVREGQNTPWCEGEEIGDDDEVGARGELVVALVVYKIANGGLIVGWEEARGHVVLNYIGMTGHLGLKIVTRLSIVPFE